MATTHTVDPCQDIAGQWRVLIDRNRCEGKEACAQVCPEGVFSIRRLTDEEFETHVKGFLPRLKVRVHGRRQAFADHEQDCRHCMRCVAACPEDAITVVAR
ncbi:4Fe-4S binding protein [Immundisolibacter sp.]|uniref:4Fe-4S binding protein n=1 Tax=Immundisolibacter sp. TaxID=1934948 RepID=UPI003561A16D